MRAALDSIAALIAEGLHVSEVVPVPRPLPCLVDVTARARSRSGDGASGDGASGTDRDGGEGQLKCFVALRLEADGFSQRIALPPKEPNRFLF